MTILDWLTTLSREPVKDETLAVLGDWLEEKGDKRSEIIRPANVTNKDYEGNITQLWFVSTFGKSSDFGYFGYLSEIEARKGLGRLIALYLLSTDPIP